MRKTLHRCGLGLLMVAACTLDGRADNLSEAQAEAARVVAGMILTLPDGTSMAWNYQQASPGIGASSRYWHHSEFNSTVVEEPLTPADRLNGLTWKGTIRTTIAAYRRAYELGSVEACWTRWEDLTPERSPKWLLRKVGGQWQAQLDSTDALEGNRLPTQAVADRALKFPLCR